MAFWQVSTGCLAALLGAACGRSPASDSDDAGDWADDAGGAEDASQDAAPCEIDGFQDIETREWAYLRVWNMYYSEAIEQMAFCDTGRRVCRSSDRVFEALAPHCYATREVSNGPLADQMSFMCRHELDWQLCTFEQLDAFHDCVEADCAIETCRVHIDEALAACGPPPPQLVDRLDDIARENPLD